MMSRLHQRIGGLGRRGLARLPRALALACMIVAVAAPAGAAGPDTQRREIESLLAGVFDAHLARFRPMVEAMKANEPAAAEQMQAICAEPESHQAFARTDATDAKRLASVETAAEDLRRHVSTAKSQERFLRIAKICRAVAMAEGNYWAGAVFALVHYLLNDRDNGDLVAAYFGSGALPATDLALARKYLEGARTWSPATDRTAILALLGALDGAVPAAEPAPAGFDRRTIDGMFQADQAVLALVAPSTVEQLRKALGDGYDRLVGRCPQVESLVPALGDDGASPPARLDAAENASALLLSEVAEVAEDPAGLLFLCLHASLSERRFWPALVYAVAYADGVDPAAAFIAATLLGSGVLGMRDYGAARGYLEIYLPHAGSEAAATKSKIEMIATMKSRGGAMVVVD